MVENRAIQYDGASVTIGDVTRPASEIVSLIGTIAGVQVTFRDGTSSIGGTIRDLYILQEAAPWATVAV